MFLRVVWILLCELPVYILLASAEEWDFNEQKMCWRRKYLKRWVYDFPLRDRGYSAFFQASSKPAVGLEVGWPYPLPQAVSWSQKSPEQRWTPAAVFTDRPTLQGTHRPCRCAQQPACWWLKSHFPSRERPLKPLSLGLAWSGVPSSPPLHREPSQDAFSLPSFSSYKSKRLIMAWAVLGSGMGERGLKEVTDLRHWHYLV